MTTTHAAPLPSYVMLPPPGSPYHGLPAAYDGLVYYRRRDHVPPFTVDVSAEPPLDEDAQLSAVRG